MSKILLCVIALALFPVKGTSTDQNDSSLPDINVSWKPNIQNRSIDLKISNKDNTPIAVSPDLHVLYSLRNEDPSTLLIDRDPKTIVAAVLIIGPHPGGLSPVVRGGPHPKPTIINAGEEKAIEFFVEQNLVIITKAKSSTTASLCLFLDHKPISMTPVTISDGSWKLK